MHSYHTALSVASTLRIGHNASGLLEADTLMLTYVVTPGGSEHWPRGERSGAIPQLAVFDTDRACILRSACGTLAWDTFRNHSVGVWSATCYIHV